MNLKTQGFILLDVDVVALNNAGKSTSTNFDNSVATKKVYKNGRTYTYVSGQAWRYWWRDVLQRNFGWELSPVIRDSKIAFTAADPVRFPDDDIFGYMKAAKETVKNEEGNPTRDKKGKEKKENVTVTRVSPLKNSVIVSVSSTNIAENWSSMARQEGDSVPYSKEEYSAIMKGMFSLDLGQVGTFASYNKTGFKNLTEKGREEALKAGATEIEDPFVKDSSGRPRKLIRLPKDVRVKRATDTIRALKVISGGAMQTNNMTDVTPKFVVLASTTTGNHPFSHIATNEGSRNERAYLSVESLKEVLKDYKSYIQGTVFIGVRGGFLDHLREQLKSLESLGAEYAKVEVKTVNEAIDEYCKTIEKVIA